MFSFFIKLPIVCTIKFLFLLYTLNIILCFFFLNFIIYFLYTTRIVGRNLLSFFHFCFASTNWMCCRKKDRTKNKWSRTSCVMCAELQNGSFVNFRINCTHCIKHEMQTNFCPECFFSIKNGHCFCFLLFSKALLFPLN